jgi:hypothetical protein
LIETTKDTQYLKSYIAKFIKLKQIKITNSSRHCYHIRFKLKGSIKDFNDLFNSINIEVTLSKRSCSSKSPTYILKSINDIEKIAKNTELYWVNNEVSQSNTGSTLFATKDLSPDSLNVTDKLYSIDELIKAVSNIIECKYNDKISTQLISLLKYSKEKSLQITINDNLNFTNNDLIVISKDYGEILSAIWLMSNLNFSKVYFPKNSNEKLIDFYAKKVSVCYPISVKSGNGGKVLLQNIIDAIKKRKKLSKNNIENEPSLKIIKIVNDNSAKLQMIKLHQYLQTKMIKDLSVIIDQPIDLITLDSVKKWSNSKTIEELKNILDKWWKNYSMPRKFNVNDQERLIIAPLGEAIKYVLNNDKKLKESLTYLAKQISILQINVDIKKDKIIFKKSFFKDSKFEFGWPGYSSGNKLGFRMVN